MKTIGFGALIAFLNLVTLNLYARGGDAIRNQAPITALLFDARDGLEGPLNEAYFKNEIDYFLDIEAPSKGPARELANLRDIGNMIASGDLNSAEGRIRSLNRFPDEKTYLRGTLFAAQGRHEAALEEFRTLIDKRQSLSNHLRSMAFIGAARVFHEIGDFAQAIYHYTQVRPLDPLFFDAVFEKTWSFYLNGDMNGSLGVSLSFLSPYFEDAFFPEAMIVRAASFYQLCYFDRASDTVEFFKKDAEALRVQLGQLLNRGVESWIYDDTTIRKIDRRIIGGLIANRDYRGSLRAFLKLKDEVRRLNGTYGTTSRQILNFVKAKMAGHAKKVLQGMDAQLRDLLAQADIIQIEILQTGANVLMGQKMTNNVPVKIIDLESVDFDELVHFWPFKLEYWLDEIGSYYYGLKSSCDA